MNSPTLPDELKLKVLVKLLPKELRDEIYSYWISTEHAREWVVDDRVVELEIHAPLGEINYTTTFRIFSEDVTKGAEIPHDLEKVWKKNVLVSLRGKDDAIEDLCKTYGIPIITTDDSLNREPDSRILAANDIASLELEIIIEDTEDSDDPEAWARFPELSRYRVIIAIEDLDTLVHVFKMQNLFDGNFLSDMTVKVELLPIGEARLRTALNHATKRLLQPLQKLHSVQDIQFINHIKEANAAKQYGEYTETIKREITADRSILLSEAHSNGNSKSVCNMRRNGELKRARLESLINQQIILDGFGTKSQTRHLELVKHMMHFLKLEADIWYDLRDGCIKGMDWGRRWSIPRGGGSQNSRG